MVIGCLMVFSACKERAQKETFKEDMKAKQMLGLTETAIDVRVIIKQAIMSNATVIALCHNHPSGGLRPSGADDSLTNKVKDACNLMRLFFLDHVIITDGGYYSYSEEGRI